ncbi:MAG: AAA domain-containing protein [Candidatus Omnitrophica bacterium]|nr:AAA domain-containing protein [Candidatus Omnitrophota bacterium]MBD3269129.1 AAA domain-containing protein [Candidatus Omnitrophota bacterium]
MEDTELKNLQVLVNNIEKVIVGKTDVIRLLITGILTNGHILLEDVPGVGKTMLSLALAKSIGGQFKRIQFTPDLLPSDVTGGMIYNPQKGEFEFRPGPVFANILLADEVNRTNPRTQSSLLECMQEFKVTIEGKTYLLKKPFMVIATQNPIEFQGTYPLPEAQVDRFLMKINVGYLEPEEEVRVIKDQRKAHPIESVKPILNLNIVNQLQDKVKEIEISEKIMEYIVNLVMATRNNENVKLGASPRASIALMNSVRAWALLEGRDYVVPDDVVHLAFWVLRHRIVLQPKATMSGLSSKDVIDDILKKTPIS